MTDPAHKSRAAGAALAGLALALAIAVALVVWLAASSDLHGSDAPGNGIAQALGLLALIIVLALLGILAVTAVLRRDWPRAASFATFILFPAVCGADVYAYTQVADSASAPEALLLTAAAVNVGLLTLHCVWGLVSPLRRLLPARTLYTIAWTGVVIACAVIAIAGASKS